MRCLLACTLACAACASGPLSADPGTVRVVVSSMRPPCRALGEVQGASESRLRTEASKLGADHVMLEREETVRVRAYRVSRGWLDTTGVSAWDRALVGQAMRCAGVVPRFSP